MVSHWEESLKVRAYDVDSNNRLKLSSFFNYMQDVASAHADNLNVGWKALQTEGLFWVLSWMKIDFENYPKFEDVIKIKTWPKGKYKLYALRDFILSDGNLEIYGKASSAWLLLNLQTKRINDLNKFLINIPYSPNDHALNVLPEKINLENSKETFLYKQVDYTDIDINEHVNNAKYIEYIQNCYDLDFHKNYKIKSLTVSFNSETKFGDKLELYKNVIGDLEHYIVAINQLNKRIAFQAIIKWVKT